METITAPTPLIEWMDGYAPRPPGGRYWGKCRHPQSTRRIAATGTSDDRFSLRECALCGSRGLVQPQEQSTYRLDPGVTEDCHGRLRLSDEQGELGSEGPESL